MTKLAKLDTKLETLKDILDPLLTSASPQKKRYAKELFTDIITDLNKAELEVQSLKVKLNGFNTVEDYISDHEKALDILILMGAGDVPFDFLTKKHMRWICEHNDNQTRPFLFSELYRIERMLRMFEGLEDRLPNSADELKDYFKNEKND
jgi:hypothetical protein